MKLMDDEYDFLRRLSCGRRLKSADRREDVVRQKMRKNGYAEVVMNPRRWVLTDAGRALLSQQGEQT